jgi:lipopolysaccharide assembly outer membrane protein LptD (OstA)
LTTFSFSLSQDTTPVTSDTLREGTVSDSLTKQPAEKKSDIEGPVKYWAKQITFAVDGKKSYLQGNVRIEYQNMELEAGRVIIDWDKNTMWAIGITDSTDSLGNPIYKENPVFKERGSEPISGTRLEYNFKNQRGKVFGGQTAMPPGYYEGEEIKKIGKKTLLVKDGYFTSCDSIKHPHTYFKSYQMRIITGKRAMAKPIIMYIEDVPVAAIPFGVFPMEKGRRSGIIIPKFNNSSYGGNSLRDFGYYWAASEYWDATLLLNFFERTGIAYEGQLRYAKRYSLNGNVQGRYAPKDVTTGQRTQRWSLSFSHNQTINETTSFGARGSFQSDKSFVRDYSQNLNDRLNQILTTDGSLSKRWPNSKNSFNASASRTENLQTGDIDYTLPRLSFSHSQSNIIPYSSTASAERKWYHDLSYSYTSNFISRGSKKFQTTDSTFRRDHSTGWQHRGGFFFNSKIFRYFKYNQTINFEELWVPRYMDYSFLDSLNNAVADTVEGFRARHTFSTSIGAATTFYGLFEIPLLPVKVIRHKMDPSISFSFSPNFTDPGFGYVQSFTDTSGRTRKFDRFAANPYGGTSSGEARSMNISVANLFQGKILRDGEEKKIDLFTMNLNTGYNFLADSLKWRNLSTNLRASASRNLDFNVSFLHSFYKPNYDGRGFRNEYVWENGFGLPRLLNVQLNSRVHIAPPPPKENAKTEVDSTLLADSLAMTQIGIDPVTQELRDFKLPWDLTANFTYTYNKNDINNIQKRFDMNLAARLEITKNWRIQYTANFNLMEKVINYQSFNIYRDLHCWEMSFSWGPNPQGYSYFSFEIHLKEPALRDIKLTKSSGGSKVY